MTSCTWDIIVEDRSNAFILISLSNKTTISKVIQKWKGHNNISKWNINEEKKYEKVLRNSEVNKIIPFSIPKIFSSHFIACLVS